VISANIVFAERDSFFCDSLIAHGVHPVSETPPSMSCLEFEAGC
jgi:hypothetical protein